MYDHARLANAALRVSAPLGLGAMSAFADICPLLVVVVLLLPTMIIAPFSRGAQEFALDVLQTLRMWPDQAPSDS